MALTSTTIRAMPGSVAPTTVHRGAVRSEGGSLASGGRMHFDSPEHAAAYLDWTRQFESDVRRDERRFIGSLLTAAITDQQHVALQHALRKLDPETARTAVTLVHLLTTILGESEQEQAA